MPVPLFDFSCRGCRHRFEALVRSGTTTACPACGSDDLEQLFPTFGVSSDSSRKANLASVRQKAEKARAERRHAEHKDMQKHLHDDH